MTSWQGAWRLYQHEIRHSWVGIILSIVFFAYIAIVSSPIFSEFFAERNDPKQAWMWLVDFLYLTILPNMGFIMNRVMFRYWQNDPYTRKIAYWRTLPIGLVTIVIARMIQLVTTLLVVGAFYFILQYVLVSDLRETLNLGQYILFAGFWFGYSWTMSSAYMYFEQAYNGKVYLIICFCFIVVYILIILACWWGDFQPVRESLGLAQNNNPIGAIVMVLIGAATMLASGHIIRKRLETRTLMN
ncbi:hypothetical protein [Paenibacillus mendelii]|uniref:ABC transporter permease n=1 Tax=Paenibacillus mendelii TaxID=206163 RepID=A0ABV6J350_9BACL|nr:hypothetical protein [Paenibacillus mendelii]MCQ6559332.1 hypothetical protein [Paenibacillus mendelii]